MPKTLSGKFDFDKAVDEFFKTFPSYKKRLFVVPRREEADQAVTAYHDFIDAHGLVDLYHDCPAEQLKDSLFYPACSMVYPPSGHAAGILPRWPDVSDRQDLITHIFRPKGTGQAYNNDALDDRHINHLNHFYFDHEIGHVLTCEALADQQNLHRDLKNHREEVAADIYALLKHYQRFGRDSDFAEFIVNIRQLDMVQENDFIHFTAWALQHAIEDCQKMDVEKLTPSQTRDFAVHYARRYALGPKEARDLTHNFAKVAGDFRENKKPDHALLQKISRISEDTKCQLTRNTVSAYLHFITTGRPAKITAQFNLEAAHRRMRHKKRNIPKRTRRARRIWHARRGH